MCFEPTRDLRGEPTTGPRGETRRITRRAARKNSEKRARGVIQRGSEGGRNANAAQNEGGDCKAWELGNDTKEVDERDPP